jgi:hypothetical protein
VRCRFWWRRVWRWLVRPRTVWVFYRVFVVPAVVRSNTYQFTLTVKRPTKFRRHRFLSWCGEQISWCLFPGGPFRCDAIWVCKRVPAFQRKNTQGRNWRQDVPPKHWYPLTDPRGVTTRKTTVDIFTAVRTSDLILRPYFPPSGQTDLFLVTGHWQVEIV